MPGRHKMASGTILVDAPIEENTMAVALYAEWKDAWTAKRSSQFLR
jgi:hypothetical protein